MVDPPFASLLIPCHNESANLDDTLGAALAQRYPADYEVIAIDDGSSDDTGARLDVLAAKHPRLRVLHLDRNLGKANALRMGALAARSEYLVCIDGDAMLEEHALHWMVWHLVSGSRVGAAGQFRPAQPPGNEHMLALERSVQDPHLGATCVGRAMNDGTADQRNPLWSSWSAHPPPQAARTPVTAATGCADRRGRHVRRCKPMQSDVQR